MDVNGVHTAPTSGRNDPRVEAPPPQLDQHRRYSMAHCSGLGRKKGAEKTKLGAEKTPGHWGSWLIS